MGSFTRPHHSNSFSVSCHLTWSKKWYLLQSTPLLKNATVMYVISLTSSKRCTDRTSVKSSDNEVASTEKHAGRTSCLRVGAASDFARSTKTFRYGVIYHELSCLFAAACFSEFGGIWHFEEIGANCGRSRGMQRKKNHPDSSLPVNQLARRALNAEWH